MYGEKTDQDLLITLTKINREISYRNRDFLKPVRQKLKKELKKRGVK